MEPYLCITQINDFIFCPRSIYFHNIYHDSRGESAYHKTWQRKGQAAHAAIDEGRYSSRKNILQGLTVYCHRYNLVGCIDTFDLEKKLLTERKYSVTRIYDGFRYQLYGQYFALKEMGYAVEEMKIYSKKSNKSYAIDLPNESEIEAFEGTLAAMREFDLEMPFSQNPAKCQHCIYNPLCDFYEEDSP